MHAIQDDMLRVPYVNVFDVTDEMAKYFFLCIYICFKSYVFKITHWINHCQNDVWVDIVVWTPYGFLGS